MSFFALIKQQVLLLSSVHEVAELEEVLDYLVRGHAVLLIDGVTKAPIIKGAADH